MLDDFSRYILAWKLCSTMRAEDVTDTLDLALVASGCASANVHHRPRLLSDNGPCYIAGELAEYIEAQRMSHVRGAPLAGANVESLGRANNLVDAIPRGFRNRRVKS